MSRAPRKSAIGFNGPESQLQSVLRGWFARPRLLVAVDLVIAVLLVLFPFVMGGREAWGHWLLISLACLLAGLWCLHRFFTGGRLRWLGLEPLLCAGLLLVWLQAQPLASGMLERVSAEYQRLIPLWGAVQATEPQVAESPESGAGASGRRWSTISFVPVETRHALLILAAYGLITAVFVQRLSTEADCRWILKLVSLSGVLMAVFAVLQLLLSNDRFFWFYRHPWTGTREVLKGAFTNRNHFAQFLALSVGPLIWWALVGRERPATSPVMNRRGLGPTQGNHSQIDTLIDAPQLLLLAAASGVLISVLLSLSRGGLVAAGTACCVVFAGLWRSGRLGASIALSMILMGFLAGAGMAVFGGQKVENRVAQLASLDASQLDESNARRSIWRADLSAMAKFPMLGTGVGSHRFVYPAYMEDLADYPTCTFSHAESSWVHLALETGWTGVILLALGLGITALRILIAFFHRSDRGRIAALAAAAAALAGGLVHSFADFIWYVPAIVVTTLALLVAAFRLCAADGTESGFPLPRVAWLGIAAGLLVMLMGVQPELQRRIVGERWWYCYLVTASDARANAAERSAEADSEEPVPLGEGDEQAEAMAKLTAEISQSLSAESSAPTDMAAYERSENAQTLQNRQRIQELRAQLALLLKSWKAWPSHPEVAVHIARRSLQLFELQQSESDNPLPLIQIRDAVLGSGFAGRQEMLEFLNRAFGASIRLPMLADTMSRNSLLLCPLQTEAWKYLIATGFLRDPQDALHLRTIAQTLRLGRFDPEVRFAIGQSLFLSGRSDDALVQWNAAFHSNRRIRRRMCAALVPRFPVQTLLQNFSPSLAELEDVFEACREQRNTNDLRRVVEVVAEQSRQIPEAQLQALVAMEANATEAGTRTSETEQMDEDGEKQASGAQTGDVYTERMLSHFLMQVAATAGEQRMTGIQESLLRRAATLAPESEFPRRALGMLLMDREDYQTADRLFAACAELNPGDTKLDQLRRECRRLQQVKNRRLRTVSN